MERNWITSDDILGKDVLDAQGELLGVIDKLFLNQDTLDVEAISIDKGFLEKGLVIGRDYIERVEKYAVFLNTTPVIMLEKKVVFSADGKRIGSITKVEFEPKTGKLVCFYIGSTQYSAEKIHQIGVNVVLKE
jgi:sporulation protein YlmC with PRC-barrel domain